MTAGELEVWGERAANGPYRTAGDASTNSPGDWERIVAHAAAFVRDPPAIWSSGDVPPRHDEGVFRVRDAAFFALVEQDATLAGEIMAWLHKQSQHPHVDFANTSLWDPQAHHGDVFRPHQYMALMVQAYDYVRIMGAGSSGQRADIEQWFQNALDWGWGIVWASTENLWDDRWQLDGSSSAPRFGEFTHERGHETSTFGRSYNNRKSTSVVFAGLAGIVLEDETLTTQAEQWVKEWLYLAVYADHDFAEMHRGSPSHTSGAGSERGYHYTSATLTDVLLVAEALARTGDTELYEWSTQGGAHGSAAPGTDKSLLFAAKAFARYANDAHERYHGTVGNPDDRIDGRRGRDGSSWAGNREILLAIGNNYWDDDEIKDAYQRNPEAGYPPYWSARQSTDPLIDASGSRTGLPGVLFMFSDLEHIPTHPLN